MSKLRKFRVIFTCFNCDIENKTKQIINNNFHGKQLKTFGILFFTYRFRFHCNTLSEVSSRSLVTAVIMWHCGWRYVRWACVWCSVVTATNKNATLLCVGGCIRLTIKVHDINFIRYWEKNCVLAQMKNFYLFSLSNVQGWCVAMTQSITWGSMWKDVMFSSSKIYGISICYSQFACTMNFRHLNFTIIFISASDGDKSSMK